LGTGDTGFFQNWAQFLSTGGYGGLFRYEKNYVDRNFLTRLAWGAKTGIRSSFLGQEAGKKEGYKKLGEKFISPKRKEVIFPSLFWGDHFGDPTNLGGFQ